jgi:hypothetical protein
MKVKLENSISYGWCRGRSKAALSVLNSTRTTWSRHFNATQTFNIQSFKIWVALEWIGVSRHSIALYRAQRKTLARFFLNAAVEMRIHLTWSTFFPVLVNIGAVSDRVPYVSPVLGCSALFMLLLFMRNRSDRESTDWTTNRQIEKREKGKWREWQRKKDPASQALLKFIPSTVRIESFLLHFFFSFSSLLPSPILYQIYM